MRGERRRSNRRFMLERLPAQFEGYRFARGRRSRGLLVSTIRAMGSGWSDPRLVA
jgi:hypothetical protein